MRAANAQVAPAPREGGRAGKNVVAPDRIRVGLPGWSYPVWKGQVYPKPLPPGFGPPTSLAQYCGKDRGNPGRGGGHQSACAGHLSHP